MNELLLPALLISALIVASSASFFKPPGSGRPSADNSRYKKGSIPPEIQAQWTREDREERERDERIRQANEFFKKLEANEKAEKEKLKAEEDKAKGVTSPSSPPEAPLPLDSDKSYHINLKNTGLLTVTKTKLSQGYRIQIVFGNHAKDWEEGKPFYEDGIWKILPSEVPGYYVLLNSNLPNAALTWEVPSPSGKWVVAIDGVANTPDYSVGGKYRADVLWKITQDGNSEYYNIYNSRFPNNGIMTWASTKEGEGIQDVQIYTEGSGDQYKTDKDYLWKFTEV